MPNNHPNLLSHAQAALLKLSYQDSALINILAQDTDLSPYVIAAMLAQARAAAPVLLPNWTPATDLLPLTPARRR